MVLWHLPSRCNPSLSQLAFIHICALELKNWCFWTVVLEKTFESPLDCEEVKLVNPIENQCWISFGRIDAKAEAPILSPPDAKIQLIKKDPDARNDWRQKEKGTTGWDGWIAALTQLTWVWASSGRQWRTWKHAVLQSMGSQRIWHDWATEQQKVKESNLKTTSEKRQNSKISKRYVVARNLEAFFWS